MAEGIEGKEGAAHPLLEWGDRMSSDIETTLLAREIKARVLEEMPEGGLPWEGGETTPTYECPHIDVLGKFVVFFCEEEETGGGIEGWTHIPADDIPEGYMGFHFFRRVSPNPYEKAFNVIYRPYGKLEVEEVAELDPVRFWDHLTSPNVYSADDPKRLLLGAVQYYPDEGRSVWTCMGLSHLRRAQDQAPPEMVEALRTAEGRTMGKDPFSVEKERLRQLLGS